ncbi:hypothetical protein MMC14_009688 [Varicellaria rhodocarpa]|nr:hypothetical protein [Varicellaria rhodocarpa]
MKSAESSTSTGDALDCGGSKETVESNEDTRLILKPYLRRRRLGPKSESCFTKPAYIDGHERANAENRHSQSMREGQCLNRPSLSYLDSTANEADIDEQNRDLVRPCPSASTTAPLNGEEREGTKLETDVDQLRAGLCRQSRLNPFEGPMAVTENGLASLRDNQTATHDSLAPAIERFIPTSAPCRLKTMGKIPSATSSFPTTKADPRNLDTLSSRRTSNSDTVTANAGDRKSHSLTCQKTLEDVQNKIVGNRSTILRIRGRILEVRSKILEIQSKILEEIPDSHCPTSATKETVEHPQPIAGEEDRKASVSQLSTKTEQNMSDFADSSQTVRNLDPQTPEKGQNSFTFAVTKNTNNPRLATATSELRSERNVTPEQNFYLSTPSSSQSTPDSLRSPEPTPFWDQTPSKHSGSSTPLTPPVLFSLISKKVANRNLDSPLASKVGRPPARSASQLGTYNSIQDSISEHSPAKFETLDNIKKEEIGAESTVDSLNLLPDWIHKVEKDSNEHLFDRLSSGLPVDSTVVPRAIQPKYTYFSNFPTEEFHSIEGLSATTSVARKLSFSAKLILEGLFKYRLEEWPKEHLGLCMAVKKKKSPVRVAGDDPWLCKHKAGSHETARKLLTDFSSLQFPSQIEELSDLVIGIMDAMLCKREKLHRANARSHILLRVEDLYTKAGYTVEPKLLLRFEKLLLQPLLDPSSIPTGPLLADDLGFRRYITKISSTLKISEHLKSIISKPLSRMELKEGFIYRYWCHTFGYSKIGWTTRDVNIRGKEWELQCHHKVDMYYPTTYESRNRRIPHAYRLEKIIHTELRDHRHEQLNCKGCSRNHQEWFKTTTDSHYHAVFKKWTDWMLEKPYEFVEATCEWRLRSERAKELDVLCQPLDPDCCRQDTTASRQPWNPVLNMDSSYQRVHNGCIAQNSPLL